MDLKRFSASGIEVRFHDFKHPEYPQLFDEFQSHLSVVDVLFNTGPESLKWLQDT
jgi:hypothetical protein